MVYFCVQPTNRPTNMILTLIISQLAIGWWRFTPNQPDQPDQFSHSAAHRKRLHTAYRWKPTTNHNQPHPTTNHIQPNQLFTYYYLTNLLLTTYNGLSVLKRFAWLDGWSVGRIFRLLRFSNFVLITPSFTLGCSGWNETTDKYLTAPARLTLFTI